MTDPNMKIGNPSLLLISTEDDEIKERKKERKRKRKERITVF